MKIKFTKMHGLGNDFMVIDGITQQIPSLTAEQIQHWSDRRFGVGFDQLLLIEKPHHPKTDFYYRIFNADGGEVGQCGNGARCLARFVKEKNLTTKHDICIETQTTQMNLVLDENQHVMVDLGPPEFDPIKIPFAGNAAGNQVIKLKQQDYSVTILSVGNPHAVLLVDNLSEAKVNEIGTAFNEHPQFPNGVNVSFLQINSKDKVSLRVYERGAGETLACGSGAAAAVVAARLLDLLNETVTVHLPGGKLQVSWIKPSGHVFLTGPAAFVFEGIIEL